MAFFVSAVRRQICCLGYVACALCTPAIAQLSPEPNVATLERGAVCAADLIELPARLDKTPFTTPSNAPIYSEADTIETTTDEIVVLRGNAQIIHGRRALYADKITYHRTTNRASAEGNVVLYSHFGDAIRAASLDLQLDTFVGHGTALQIQFAERQTTATPTKVSAVATATAQHITLQGDNLIHLKQVTMTTCTATKKDIQLHAEEIQLDHAKGIGTAKSVTVTFKETPIFYFPSMTFPLSAQRKTGFLLPNIGYANDSGWNVEIPYYLNLAPAYDAELTPTWISRRGAQLLGEFRYLNLHGGGRFRGEWLPADDQFNDKQRYAFGYTHRHAVGERWRAAVDWNTVSDRTYLRDFSNNVATVAESYIVQNASLEYFGKHLQFTARTTAYEVSHRLSDDLERPYDISPQLGLTLAPSKLGLLEVGATAKYTNFRHDLDQSALRRGTRLQVTPYLSLPLRKTYGYLVPKVAINTTRYTLDRSAPNARQQTSSPSVTVPVISLDSGLFFERPIFQNPSGLAKYTQTIEPRLLYIKIPVRSKQSAVDFPNFDSGLGSASSFAHFFRENRFFGGDRIGDTEQISLELTSRIRYNQRAQQLLKMSLGKVFYLQDRLLGITAETPAERASTSGLFAELAANITDRWNLSGFVRAQDNQSKLAALRFSAGYTLAKHRYATFGYTSHTPKAQTIDDSEQIDFTFAIPLYQRWRLQSATNYSLQNDELQSAELGLDFTDCCWAIRFVAKRYLDDSDSYKNSFTVVFQLATFGRVGGYK